MSKLLDILRRKILIVSLICLLLPGLRAFAQEPNPVLLECVNINKAYQATSYLSFNARYTYASEIAPTDLQDSAHAVYKMNGLKYWVSFDSLELMQNDSFQITMHHRETLIGLGFPTYRHAATLPMSHWDSIFLRNDKFTYSIDVDSGFKKITADYDANMPYKKFEIWYDSVSYRIYRMRYKIDQNTSDESYDISGTLSGAFDEVNIYFSNYQTGLFTNAVFNSANYIAKIDGIYYPAPDYEVYELFIVSPGLK
jgi:hypothetical protein